MKLRQRASSLAEVIVALAVFGLVAGLITGVFILSHRYTRVSQQVSRAQREAARCIQAMSIEFNRGHSQTFRPLPAVPNQVWFLSNRPLDGNPGLGEFNDQGEILWQKWVGMWGQPDGSVYRSEFPVVGGAVPFQDVDMGTAPTSLVSFSTLSGKRRIASAIRSFSVTVDSRVVTVELESQTSNSGNPSTLFRLTSSFLVP